MLFNLAAVDWEKWAVEMEMAVGKMLDATVAVVSSTDAVSTAMRAVVPPLQDHSEQEDVPLIVLSYVAGTAKQAYGNLQFGFASLDLARLSWAARNLLELQIWNRYIWRSPENLRRFQYDRCIDEYEIYRAVLDFRQLTGISGADARSEDIRNKLASIQASWKESKPKHRPKRLQVSAAAKEVGLEPRYRLLFKVLSNSHTQRPCLFMLKLAGISGKLCYAPS